MSEFLTEIFTGLILEGTIGQNIRYFFLKLFGKDVTKEQLANEAADEKQHKQKRYNVLVGFLALVFVIIFAIGIIILIFGNN